MSKQFNKNIKMLYNALRFWRGVPKTEELSIMKLFTHLSKKIGPFSHFNLFDSQLLAVLLMVVFVISFMPVTSMFVSAVDTGKKLIVTHNIDLGDDLVLHEGGISLDSQNSINLGTSSGYNPYYLEQYYPKSVPDGTSYLEKGYTLIKIVVGHDGKIFEYYMPNGIPSGIVYTDLLEQGLGLTGRDFILYANIFPNTAGAVGFLYRGLDPITDITVDFI
ncbi:MAG: hypothetical protein FWF62_00905, partial [Candidatus Bathyarchaeota archaeon]|nr:hypothetical protein [Candidatus Termiticorpusculum sp.]